jgi:metal-responsive CopG/Arc/MetJ family transcriptional regulator
MTKSLTNKASVRLGTAKITLTIPRQLLERVDTTAQRDYSSRSDVIRQALVDYLRQYELATAGLEPEAALKIVRRHMSMASFNKMLKETTLDERH